VEAMEMKNVSGLNQTDSLNLDKCGWLPAEIPRVARMEGKQRRKILVVDDQKGLRDIMAALLSDLGYDVATAADGAEALMLLQGSTFGLVLTDLNMPGMDGWSLAERVKKASSTPVVLITASHKRSVEERLGKSSVDSVLFKPFRVEDLLTVVRKTFTEITSS
jgi:CheY-like chemotaxis protein